MHAMCCLQLCWCAACTLSIVGWAGRHSAGLLLSMHSAAREGLQGGAGTAGACSPRAGPEADWLVGSSGFEGEAASGVVLLPTTPAPAAAAPGAGLAASWLPELLLGFGAGP